MYKKVLFSLLSLFLVVGCAKPQEPIETKSNICIDCGFDTFFSIQGYVGEQETFDTLFKEASEEFKHYNDLFDIYYEYPNLNNLKTINQQAGIEPVKVDPIIIELLEEAKHYYDLSGGQFDITMGTLLKVWHTYRSEGISLNEDGEYGEVPPQELLEKQSQYRGWEHIHIDKEKSTVYIDDPNISLDVGGIAKGFATEKIAEKLIQEGAKNGAVNAGGNNRTLGQKADGTSWRVGIQNPAHSGSLLTISIDGECSFVTSGDYERTYVASDEKSYHHIIDPHTLYPATYYHSVSIVTTDSGAADCLSTTLFTMPYEEGLKLIETFRKEHPEDRLEVIWILDETSPIQTDNKKVIDGQLVVYTEGLKDVIKWATPQ
ncbi:MAG: FAD:protein FMN transferase [Solobacterium sp.]|nr:FAD:protein FMN transferase [Solobacterium sp.]